MWVADAFYQVASMQADGDSWLLGNRARPLYEAFLQAIHLQGDVAECGVAYGATARNLAAHLAKIGSRKTLHLFDSCEGLPASEMSIEERGYASPGEMSATAEQIKKRMWGLKNWKLYPGLFKDTLPKFNRALCFVHADADLENSTTQILVMCKRCLVPGGLVVVDDYGNTRFPGVQRAVDGWLLRCPWTVVAKPPGQIVIQRKGR